MNDIKQAAKEIKDEVISFRRHFHKYPELGNEEVETAKFIQEQLRKLNIPYRSQIAGNGVLGIIEGESGGGVVALRADMDALPIEEKTGLSFSSTKKGIMHACGHDAHMAILLGVAKILRDYRKKIKGTILLVFQPAEEKAPIGGARPMLEDGVFDDYQPDVIYGLHVWPDLKVGQFGIREEEMMGASDSFLIRLKGVGGHASMPETTTDPVVTAAHLVTNLQTIVSRSLDPLEAAVVTVAKIDGGSARNIIPREVQIEGSIRTYKREIKEKIQESLYRITEHTAKMFHNEAEIHYYDGYPATINTPRWAKLARDSARTLFGPESIPVVKPSLAAEDFSRFLEEIPGAFIWLGSQPKDMDLQKGLHDEAFTIDEAALEKGVAFLTYTALQSLEELQ